MTADRDPGFFDLHLHSCWSYDAFADPELYFQEARRKDFKYISITDHNNMDAYVEVASIIPKYPDVKLIPGVELTVTTELGVFDFICLGLPYDVPDSLKPIFESYKQWQIKNGDAWCEGMEKLGFKYSRNDRLELLKKYRPQAALDKQGITHVKNEIQLMHFVYNEYIRDISHSRDLKSKLEKVVNFPPYPDVETVLSVAKSSGALIFLAHPHRYFRKDLMKKLDELCRILPLDGIECAHSTMSLEYSVYVREYCVHNNLLSSAGSDCHSLSKDKNIFGKHKGCKLWLDEIFQKLNWI